MEKPKFFKWAFLNGMTILIILILFFISFMWRYTDVPSVETINGELVYGTEMVFSWLAIFKVFIPLVIIYGLSRFGTYYFKFIMKDEKNEKTKD